MQDLLLCNRLGKGYIYIPILARVEKTVIGNRWKTEIVTLNKEETTRYIKAKYNLNIRV